MLGAAKGLSSVKVSSQSVPSLSPKPGERRMENEQKTFIYILKVDASISPKSISVPHIFGALPTYGTFKVGPRPSPPWALQNLSGFTTQQKTRPAVEEFRQLTWKKREFNLQTVEKNGKMEKNTRPNGI